MNTWYLKFVVVIFFIFWSCAATGNDSSNYESREMRTSQTAATSFTDRRDNKTYRIVQIGDQVWMAENLNYQTGNSWCYDDNEANCTKYGRLYDWHTAVNACPAGWQLANDDDWHILVQVVGGSTIAGIKLGSKNGWVSGSLGGAVVVGTDNFGFSALPGGYRHRPVEGSYYTYLGNNGFWWSATENVDNIAYIQCILYFNEDMLRYRADKNQGLSVRCIRRD